MQRASQSKEFRISFIFKLRKTRVSVYAIGMASLMIFPFFFRIVTRLLHALSKSQCKQLVNRKSFKFGPFSKLRQLRVSIYAIGMSSLMILRQI